MISSLEPTTDTSSSVLVFDPLGSLVAWTIIEAVAVRPHQAAFKSLHHNYHHGYHKPYLILHLYSRDILRLFFKDILDLSGVDDFDRRQPYQNSPPLTEEMLQQMIGIPSSSRIPKIIETVNYTSLSMMEESWNINKEAIQTILLEDLGKTSLC
ncbi:hypothetical protein CEXT_805521 [Caerostris extrusa]|uniref:Uncharacterized protein n=1 Tax=Caerostris extrusa TaxID=172846 RepID=A0AAV4WCI7_CAEEX|nr:hypothetical protein CEXT_805521 [Caerostris extrusa]